MARTGKGSYVALKAQYYLDDAVLEAGPDAELLWVRILSFLASVRTDGKLTDRQLKSVGYGLRNVKRRVEKLQEVGLLLHEGAHYEARSWQKWNRSSQEIDNYLAAERERKARKKAENAENSGRNGEGFRADSALSTVQSSSVQKEVANATSRRASKGTRLPADWTPSRDDVQAIAEQCPGLDTQAEHPEFVDYWISVAGARGVKLDWSATWRNWMRKQYKDRGPKRALMTSKASPGQKARSVADELRMEGL